MPELQSLTLQQASRKIGKSEKTLRSWIKKGKLQAELQGQVYKIKPEDLDDVTTTVSKEWNDTARVDEMQNRITALELNIMDCAHAIDDLQKAVKKLQPKRTPAKRKVS